MNILHTESSQGWGGQEIRILREAEGLRERGYNIILAVTAGGGLVTKAREKGFMVYEVPMRKKSALSTLVQLQRIIKDHEIHIVNTHSSWDSWMGGIAARLTGRKVLRTRHLSTKIRGGINSRILYNSLADFVVTTSSCIISSIIGQSKLSADLIRCIPTGVDPSSIKVEEGDIHLFRNMLVKPDEILVGTVCFVRSWKGVQDLMKAAQIVKHKNPKIKWVVVGGGYYKEYIGALDILNIKDVVTFTGNLDSPYSAMAALDIFLLLSTNHEGISQASLQASYLKRPLITTSIGGLPEVCLHESTGLVVPPFSPEKVAEAVLRLAADPSLRKAMGENAHALVVDRYTLTHTLDQMEQVYKVLLPQTPPRDFL
ncbi:MAG: glycosyltransferase family 4 protein [Chlamydiae bacterium]|nr:glycosyltransferase family 4 protein [Chlamydiota bacterium]